VHALGLKNSSPRRIPILELIEKADTFEHASEQIKKIYDAKLIVRERLLPAKDKKNSPGTHNYRRYCPLFEGDGPNLPKNAILCNEKHGFLVIGPNESVIIVSKKDSGKFKFYTYHNSYAFFIRL
jgi:hypothetical protein